MRFFFLFLIIFLEISVAFSQKKSELSCLQLFAGDQKISSTLKVDSTDIISYKCIDSSITITKFQISVIRKGKFVKSAEVLSNQVKLSDLKLGLKSGDDVRVEVKKYIRRNEKEDVYAGEIYINRFYIK